MEPQPNPNSKDNRPGSGYRNAAIAFLTLAGLSAYQEYKTMISDARKELQSVNKNIDKRIDDIYNNLDEIDPKNDQDEYNKLVEEKSVLQDLRKANNDYEKGLEYTENALDDLYKQVKHSQDATRRRSDSNYNQKFLDWYYKENKKR